MARVPLTIFLFSALAAHSAGQYEQVPKVKSLLQFDFRGPVLEDRDVSGIAMATPELGMIAADEGAAVQTFRLARDAGIMRVMRTISLLGKDDLEDAEFDLEAVAFDDGAYYVIGSHGVARTTGQVQPSRHQLFRIPVDPYTGQPIDAASGNSAIQRTSLMRLFADYPLLARYVDQPLQQRGLNIEGLAVKRGQMFVGLRGPNVAGVGFILETSVENAFRDVPQTAVEVHAVQLGTGYGIRDMTPVSDGLLLLLGNSNAEPVAKFTTSLDYDEDRPFLIAHWDGQGRTVALLAQLADAEGKAEGMWLLHEEDLTYEMLILFDGPNRGRPSIYRTPRPQ